MTFFALPEAAERAGFRSCLRCRPRAVRLRDPQAERVQRVCRFVAEHLEEPLTLDRLSREAGLAPHHLQRTFKRVMGISPRAYADALRMGVFRQRVRKGAAVIDAIFEAGYGSTSRLYERAPAQLGMTPAAFRKGGRGLDLRYTIVPCPLGRLLVAATERGVSLVSLGDADAALERVLRDEYPAAGLTRDDAALAEQVRHIVKHLEGREPHLDLPVDVRATAFQWRVWEELRRIPHGETRSYAEVARAIGRPARGAGGRARLRHQPGRAGRALPPRGARGRRSGRLPLGRGAEGAPARERSGQRPPGPRSMKPSPSSDKAASAPVIARW